MIILTSPRMSPLSVKAPFVVIVGTVTGPIRDWLWGKRDAVQNSVWIWSTTTVQYIELPYVEFLEQELGWPARSLKSSELVEPRLEQELLDTCSRTAAEGRHNYRL